VEEVKRVRVLDVHLDAVESDTALASIKGNLDDEHQQIIFLSMENFFRARRDPEFSRALRQARLVLPVSKRIERAAHFLGRRGVHRYVPFDFVIRLLDLAENNDNTVYLLGARKDDLEQAERNLRASFPRLRLVGRYAGYYPPRMEPDLMTAIKKASPNIILIGSGVQGRELWALRRRKHLPPGVSLWVNDCFEVFAGRARQISRGAYSAGLESYAGWLHRPWVLLRGFRNLVFLLLVLIHRLRKL